MEYVFLADEEVPIFSFYNNRFWILFESSQSLMC